MNKIIKTPFLMAEDTGGGGTLTDEEFINDVPDSTPASDNVDDTDDNPDDEEPIDEVDENDEIEEVDEVDEDDEVADEEEIEEVDEDIEPAQAATFKNIKEKYPTIFKEFPDLEKAFGTTRRYEAAFSSPEEAQQAAQRLEIVDSVLSDLEVGNPISLIHNFGNNKAGLTQFAKNILPALNRANPDAFYEAALPVISAALRNATREAEKMGDTPYAKNLALAAKYISKFVFDDENVPEFKTQNRNEVDPEKIRLIREREDFIKSRYSEFATDINSTVKNEVVKLIGAELKGLKVNLSEYTKKKITDDIFKTIDNELNQDPTFVQSMRGLVKKAERTGFTDRALSSRIKAAFLERGKGRVSKVTRTVLKNERLLKFNSVKKSLNNSGVGNRNQQTKTRNINPKQVDYRSTSDLDILNDNVKVRGK
jgi:hypothetical protein